MATGKVNVLKGNDSVERVYVSTLDDGAAFEFNHLIFIKNTFFDDSGNVYRAFSICGQCVMVNDEKVTPVDLEIKVIR